MNHLNFFAPFESRTEKHEDVLTRNFLILVKNIPLVQIAFFEMVRDNLNRKNVDIESISKGQLKVSEVYTQVDSNSTVFDDKSDVRVISIIISDDELNTEHEVTDDERHARYDGLFLCEPDTLFILENKPYVGNVWENQLNPNLKKIENAQLINIPCTLSWRNTIGILNDLLNNELLNPLEESVINDFLEYIDNYYSWLNPYDNFSLCKANKYLLDRRCCQIMSSYPAAVNYHKGWKYYINIGSNIIKEFALDSEVNNNLWRINLWMYVGDTMNSSRISYNALNIKRLEELIGSDNNYSISSNLHFSPIQNGLVWCESPVSFIDYIKFWCNEASLSKINRLKRENFDDYLAYLQNNQLITAEGKTKFEKEISTKNYQGTNVCPGFLIKYTWDMEKAIKLDNSNEFIKDFKRVISDVLNVFE